MEIDKLLLGVLTKTLNKTEDELAALIYTKAEGTDDLIVADTALEALLEIDASRVENIKKSVKPDNEILKKQYFRGKKEALEELEKQLKEAYEIDSDKEGVELVSQIVTAQKGKSKLTDEEVKKHPLYLSLEKERVPKEQHEKVLKDFDDYKNSVQRNEKLSSVRRTALGILKEMNPVISPNPKVAQTREDDFLSKFDSYDFEIQEDGNHLVLKNGERLEDAHGNPLKFRSFVEDIAIRNYDFREQDKKGSPGNEKPPATGTGNNIPKSEAEYVKLMTETHDPKVRAELTQAWDQAQRS